MIVGKNADGRLELFVGRYHSWQVAPNNGWNLFWVSLTGNPNPSVQAVAQNADGRLEAYGVDFASKPSHLFHTYQTAPNNGWSNWERLDEDDNNDWASEPTVGRNVDGRLEIFVRGTNNALYHKWQQSPGHDWHDWTKIDGTLAGKPIVAQSADGYLEVFARGPFNNLYHISQRTSWSSWDNLSGNWLVDHPVIGQNADGRLEIFIYAPDNTLSDKWQTAPNNGWSNGWFPFGQWAVRPDSEPAVGRNANGCLQIFTFSATDISGGGAIYTKQQTAPNNGWSDWIPLGYDVFGGLSIKALSDPTVGINADGRLEIYIVGSDGAIYNKWQVVPGGDWSQWANLGSPPLT